MGVWCSVNIMAYVSLEVERCFKCCRKVAVIFKDTFQMHAQSKITKRSKRLLYVDDNEIKCKRDCADVILTLKRQSCSQKQKKRKDIWRGALNLNLSINKKNKKNIIFCTLQEKIPISPSRRSETVKKVSLLVSQTLLLLFPNHHGQLPWKPQLITEPRSCDYGKTVCSR